MWFKYFKGPWERWHYEKWVCDLRAYGNMIDDTYQHRDALIERVLEVGIMNFEL